MKLPGALTRNWSIKLISLLLALIVFYAVRTTTTHHGRANPVNFLKGNADAPAESTR